MTQEQQHPQSEQTHDVIILGGALSGAATATILLRRNPGIRVLIIEKNEKLGRRVGEATVEISGFFMCRVLGLTGYLNENHLVKQGLRFWFKNDEVTDLSKASELGAKYLSRIISFQLDRSTFDEEVLRRAVEAGAELLRPATVLNVELNEGGLQRVEVRAGGENRILSAPWVVDASGMATFLARKNGWRRQNTEHPTAAVWSRWKNVKNWDSRELGEKYPEWSRAVYGTRNTATNHVIGDGWWSWWIPLKGGDVSIGVVYDQRLLEFPKEGGNAAERLKTFLMQHPVGREILVDAEYDPEDVLVRKNLAYYSEKFAGNGFVLVGDAAAFMDPFYSPGMDWISFTTSSAANLITEARAGKAGATEIAKYNRDFKVAHQRWFEAVYKDKYEYMGEFDLMSLAFRLDLGLYYWGVVEVPFNHGETALHAPPFSPPSGKIFHWLMSTYNRRFAKMARRRRKGGRLGASNNGRRCLIPGFRLDRKNMLSLFGMLAEWGWLELKEGWRSWFDSDNPYNTAPAFGSAVSTGPDRDAPVEKQETAGVG